MMKAKLFTLALVVLAIEFLGSCRKNNDTEVLQQNLPEGALPGEFSISSTKKIHFSKGNLTCDISAATPEWKFYEHQYDCAAEGDASNSLISLFTWGYSPETSVVPDGMEYVTGHTTDGDILGKSEDWGYVFGGESSVWRTLSTAEWQYLFSYDGTRGGILPGGTNYDNDTRRGKYIYGVTVFEKTNCVVLLPDIWDETVISPADFASTRVYNDTSSPTWQAMEDAGAVCLPATGSRQYGTSVFYAGVYGEYWSSSANSSSSAYRLTFSGDDVDPGKNSARFNGYSVRLITESN